MDKNVTNTTADLFETAEYPAWCLIFENVYMILVALFGVPGNLLCIVVQTKFMKSSTDFYILSMALFDFVCSAVNAPMFVIRNVDWLRRTLSSVAFCIIHKLLVYMTSVSSSLLLAAVAVNRYYLTCKPTSNANFKLNSRAKDINVGIAIFSVGVCIWIVAYESYDDLTGMCQSDISLVLYVLKGLVMLLFILMFVVASICYTNVVFAIRKQHRINIQRRQCNASKEDERRNSKPDSSEEQRKWSLKQKKVKPTSLQNMETPSTSTTDSKNEKKLGVQTAPVECKESGYGSQENHVKPVFMVVPLQISKLANTNSKLSDKLKQRVSEQQAINNVTLMLFLITLLYIITWIMHWIYAFVDDVKDEFVKGVLRSIKNIFMINCVANPIFYSLMSSKFRSKLGALFNRT